MASKDSRIKLLKEKIRRLELALTEIAAGNDLAAGIAKAALGTEHKPYGSSAKAA